MPIRVLILDMQGTLGTTGYRLPSGEIKTQSGLLQEGLLVGEYGAVPDGYSEVPVLNGISPDDTRQALNDFVAKGGVVYIATGDGSHEEEVGRMRAPEAIRDYGLPIPSGNIISWDTLRQNGIDPSAGDRKNSLLRFIMERREHGINPDEVLFLDDGPGNVNAARRIGVEARQIDLPVNLTDALHYAVTKST